MTLRHLLVIPTLLCATVASGQTAPQTAHADIVNAQGMTIGMATISPSTAGVTIALKVSQLPPGVHGIHIHTVGKCEGPAFASAGGHLNPEMKMHGKDNPMGPHAGDLLNFTVDAGGAANRHAAGRPRYAGRRAEWLVPCRRHRADDSRDARRLQDRSHRKFRRQDRVRRNSKIGNGAENPGREKGWKLGALRAGRSRFLRPRRCPVSSSIAMP